MIVIGAGPSAPLEIAQIEKKSAQTIEIHQTTDCRVTVQTQTSLEGKRVIVVGAGPSGLAAAHHLERRGASVTVLEARDRVGGRIYTNRTQFSQPCDYGAQLCTGVSPDLGKRVAPDPTALLCRQLGIELLALDTHHPLFDGTLCY